MPLRSVVCDLRAFIFVCSLRVRGGKTCQVHCPAQRCVSVHASNVCKTRDGEKGEREKEGERDKMMARDRGGERDKEDEEEVGGKGGEGRQKHSGA